MKILISIAGVCLILTQYTISLDSWQHNQNCFYQAAAEKTELWDERPDAMLSNFLTDILAAALLCKYVIKSQNTTLVHGNGSLRNFSDSGSILECCILQSGHHIHGPTIHGISRLGVGPNPSSLSHLTVKSYWTLIFLLTMYTNSSKSIQMLKEAIGLL